MLLLLQKMWKIYLFRFWRKTGRRLFDSKGFFRTWGSLIGLDWYWMQLWTELGGVTYRLSLSGLSKLVEVFDDSVEFRGMLVEIWFFAWKWPSRSFCLNFDRLKNNPRMHFSRPFSTPEAKNMISDLCLKNWNFCEILYLICLIRSSKYDCSICLMLYKINRSSSLCENKRMLSILFILK